MNVASCGLAHEVSANRNSCVTNARIESVRPAGTVTP